MPSQYELLAREALLEITPADTIGELASESTDDDGVITLRFESVMLGYPNWQWNVSLAHVEGFDPTVIEAELMPDAGALLAPDWVPWSERLADYEAAQAEQAGAGSALEGADEDVDDMDDVDDDDLDAQLDDEDDDSLDLDLVDDDDEVDDDDVDDDGDDDDDDGPPTVVHGGDIDGVDIDELDDLDDIVDIDGDDGDDEADDREQR